MGKIVCIAWGSLVWNPKNLLIDNKWHNDGPHLPIEFFRQSNDGRLTLVINDKARPVQTLWSLMKTEKVSEARKSLQLRENINDSNIDDFVGVVHVSEETKNPIKLIIQSWLKTKEFDCAIWTNLPPKFNNIKNRIPTIAEAINYLSSLDSTKSKLAEEYIRKTPKQILTEYRTEFEVHFNWTFIE